MILGCPQCETRFRIDDEKVRAAGVKVRCSRCAHTFIARPEDGEPEPPEPTVTSTRRVDPAMMIALAKETAAPLRNPHTEEIPLPSVQEESEALFPDRTEPSDEGRLDDLHGVLGMAHGDPFDQLDATPEHPSADDFMAEATAPAPGSAPSYDLSAVPDLAGVSADLPASPPQSSSFLDPGGHPSQDVGFLDELEKDFFPGGSEGSPAAPDHPSGPPSGTFGASFSATGASFEPTAAPGPFSMFGDLDKNGDLIDGPDPDDSRLARIDLVSSENTHTHTRIASATAPTRARTTRVVVPRPIGGWPTWLGLVVGVLVSITFFPGVAPAPFDGIGPAVTAWLHPAAAARLPDALQTVRSVNASAFPYALDNQTVVIVRGEAVNLGDEALSGIYAHVLMLDGDREVGRAFAPLGDAPNPVQLRRRLHGEEPPPPIPISPGDRLPFLVVFRAPGPEAGRFRFRVEFTPRDS